MYFCSLSLSGSVRYHIELDTIHNLAPSLNVFYRLFKVKDDIFCHVTIVDACRLASTVLSAPNLNYLDHKMRYKISAYLTV